jgi:hypothetical protein
MGVKQARLQSGTIIVYVPKEKDFNPIENDGFFETKTWPVCKKNFHGPVEVYNINGFTWDDLIKRARRLEIFKNVNQC